MEWLGEVPGHWEVRPLKHLARLQTGMTPPTDEWDNYADEEGFQCVRPEDLDERGTPTTSSKFLTKKGWMQTRQIKAGASLICCIGTIGKVGITTDTVSTNQQITAAEPKEDSRYLFYAICAGRVELELASTGNVLRILNTERLGNISWPNPPLPEQIQIVTFLDRETAKIDALVAEQRRLMALLKEKRQAVISHAVTKGLNPAAPMKPSGIEWLGDVPAHWEVGPLKRFWSVTDCKHVTAEFVDDGFPLASIREVQSRWVALENAKCTTEHFYEVLVEGNRQPLAGDLIFSRNATVGEVAQVHADHPRFAMGQDVVLLRKLSPNYSSDYLQHVIRSPIIILQLANMMIGSTFKRINVEEIRSFLIPSPPPTEQAEIANFLEGEVAKFDNLTAEAQRAIDLLQERRTALISAAVTGQIDVRGAV